MNSVSHHTLLIALRGVPLVAGLLITTNITTGTGNVPSHPLIDPRHDWIWSWH